MARQVLESDQNRVKEFVGQWNISCDELDFPIGKGRSGFSAFVQRLTQGAAKPHEDWPKELTDLIPQELAAAFLKSMTRDDGDGGIGGSIQQLFLLANLDTELADEDDYPDKMKRIAQTIASTFELPTSTDLQLLQLLQALKVDVESERPGSLSLSTGRQTWPDSDHLASMVAFQSCSVDKLKKGRACFETEELLPQDILLLIAMGALTLQQGTQFVKGRDAKGQKKPTFVTFEQFSSVGRGRAGLSVNDSLSGKQDYVALAICLYGEEYTRRHQSPNNCNPALHNGKTDVQEIALQVTTDCRELILFIQYLKATHDSNHLSRNLNGEPAAAITVLDSEEDTAQGAGSDGDYEGEDDDSDADYRFGSGGGGGTSSAVAKQMGKPKSNRSHNSLKRKATGNPKTSPGSGQSRFCNKGKRAKQAK